MTKDRIDRRFAALKAENRAGFVTYVMAGDPDGLASQDWTDRVLSAITRALAQARQHQPVAAK